MLKDFIFRTRLKQRAGVFRICQSHWWIRKIFQVPMVASKEYSVVTGLNKKSFHWPSGLWNGCSLRGFPVLPSTSTGYLHLPTATASLLRTQGGTKEKDFAHHQPQMRAVAVTSQAWGALIVASQQETEATGKPWAHGQSLSLCFCTIQHSPSDKPTEKPVRSHANYCGAMGLSPLEGRNCYGLRRALQLLQKIRFN